MKVALQYGKGELEIVVPFRNVTVLKPHFLEGLPDEAASFRDAMRQPIGAKPLSELILSTDKVAVVIPDITRALPSDRLLPWLFEELSHVPAANFTIVNGTGSHRGNTPEELEGMVGKEVASRYRIVNHDAHDSATLEIAGTAADGRVIKMNREYVQAEKRIVLGFIEPHFMAGFSGGYKGAFPAVAGIRAIMHYHRAEIIGDARSTWGVLNGNPTQAQVREYGAIIPLHFCINVTLNHRHEITRFFCGDPIVAHDEGCAFAKATAMVPCKQPFPLVITSNGGYPLDQNLYQAVKGMSAAAQIVAPGGDILCAALCNDGFPAHGNFTKLLFEYPSPRALLDAILSPGFHVFDQWQVQILANVLLKAGVSVYSSLNPEEVKRAHLNPVSNIESYLEAALKRLGPDAPVAVLPEGPMTIPYLENA